MTCGLRRGHRGHGMRHRKEPTLFLSPFLLESLKLWVTSISCCWVSLSEDQPHVMGITQQHFQPPSRQECGVLTQIGLTQTLFVSWQIKAAPNSSGCEKWKQKGSELKRKNTTTLYNTAVPLCKERPIALLGNVLTPCCIFLYTGSTWSQRC